MNETDNQTKMYLLSNVFKIAVGCLMLTLASCGTAKLSVMSFNVRQSHAKEVNPNDSWDNRKEACLEMLKTRKPDLVGFQEAQFKGQWSFFRDSLASEYGSVGIGRDNGVDKGETSGFLYKKSVFTLLDSGTFWVSETPDVPSKSFDEKYNRSLTWGLFKVNKTGKRFFYFNTHLGLTWKSQVEGVNMIVGKMKELNPEEYGYLKQSIRQPEAVYGQFPRCRTCYRRHPHLQRLGEQEQGAHHRLYLDYSGHQMP